MAIERSNPVIEHTHRENKGRVVTLERAREMFKGRVMGPEEIKQAWGIELRAEAIPAIPYSQQTLEERLLGEDGFLRLGVPISIAQMEERLKAAVIDRYGSDTLRPQLATWREEALFTKETPRLGWSIPRRTILPLTRSKNYFEQTKIVREHGVRLGILSTEDCEESSDEILTQLASLLTQHTQDTKERTELVMRLAQLPVNQKMRRSAADVYFDIATSYLSSMDPILSRYNDVDVTKTATQHGHIVSVGNMGRSLLLVQQLIDPVYPSHAYSVAGCAPYLAV